MSDEENGEVADGKMESRRRGLTAEHAAASVYTVLLVLRLCQHLGVYLDPAAAADVLDAVGDGDLTLADSAAEFRRDRPHISEEQHQVYDIGRRYAVALDRLYAPAMAGAFRAAADA